MKKLLTLLLLIVNAIGNTQTISLQSFATGFNDPVAIDMLATQDYLLSNKAELLKF